MTCIFVILINLSQMPLAEAWCIIWEKEGYPQPQIGFPRWGFQVVNLCVVYVLIVGLQESRLLGCFCMNDWGTDLEVLMDGALGAKY